MNKVVDFDYGFCRIGTVASEHNTNNERFSMTNKLTDNLFHGGLVVLFIGAALAFTFCHSCKDVHKYNDQLTVETIVIDGHTVVISN